MRTCTCVPLLFALVGLAFIPQPVLARLLGPPPALNPRTYVSPSGEYACFVDPSELHGCGPADYRLTRRNQTVWAGTKPFTLFEAGVTDDGCVAGYAYTQGEEGFGGKRGGLGEFQVVILDPTGALRLHEQVKRVSSRFPDDLPNPLAHGLVVDGPNNRFVVRVRDEDVNRAQEAWWTYELSTGKSLGRPALRPGDVATGSPIRAQTVPGTPLTLLHYWRFSNPDVGARFALVDLQRKEVWSLTWARDYVVPGDEAAEDRLLDCIRERGAILETGTNRFALRCEATAERVNFTADAIPQQLGKWRVQEISRARHTLPAAPAQPQLPAFPERPLKLLGTFTLQAGTPTVPSPVRGVTSFDFDDRERIGLLRRDDAGRSSFALVESQEGRLIRELQLPAGTNSEPAADLTLAWLGGERWLLAQSEPGVDGKVSASWLDTASGKLEAIAGFTCPSIRSLAGARDGGFVALTVHRSKYSLTDELIGFDPAGKARWSVKEDSSDEQALFSPEAVAVTSRGEVAVLDNIREAVQFYSPAGRYLRTVALEKSWGREPNYPTEIAADTEGGVLIQDFQGSPPIVRMSAEGKVIAQFTPRHADGRVVDAFRGVKVSPSGGVWACDGESVVRLTGKGVVDRVLGASPSADTLGRIAAVDVDQQGRLYAADERTGCVHVFNQSGERLRVCRPDARDFTAKLVNPSLAATPDGAVWLGDRLAGAKRADDSPGFVEFAPDGQRAGVRRPGLDEVQEELYALPAGGRFLILGYHDAFIWSPTGKVIRQIQRRPDRNWLERPARAAIAPDGAFAVVSGGGFYFKQPWHVSLYSPQGEPLRTVTMPAVCRDFCVAFSGKHLATATETEVLLFDVEGRPVLRFAPPVDRFKEDGCAFFATHQGRELWLVSPSAQKVTRYELP